MLVKMAHKDWTAIDRQWITSQAKRVRANMHAACHFGCEGTVSPGGHVLDAMPLAGATGSVATGDNDPENVTIVLKLPADLEQAVQDILKRLRGLVSASSKARIDEDPTRGTDTTGASFDQGFDLESTVSEFSSDEGESGVHPPITGEPQDGDLLSGSGDRAATHWIDGPNGVSEYTCVLEIIDAELRLGCLKAVAAEADGSMAVNDETRTEDVEKLRAEVCSLLGIAITEASAQELRYG
jgi:hypothetical protein